MGRWLWTVLLLIASADIYGAYRVQTCTDPYRPDAVAYLGDPLPGCKFDIQPYCIADRDHPQGDWYIFFDDAGEYIERLLIITGPDTLAYPRDATPALVCYDSKQLSLYEVAWVPVDEKFFKSINDAAEVQFYLERGEERTVKAKFPPKSRDALAAFRDSVFTRLADLLDSIYSKPPAACDGISIIATDTVTVLHPYSWPLSKLSRWWNKENPFGEDVKTVRCDCGAFTVEHPERWVVTRDPESGGMNFGMKDESPVVQMFPVTLSSSDTAKPEGQIADDYRREQELVLLRDVVWTHQYEMREVSKGTACVNGIRTYYFTTRLFDILYPGGFMKSFHIYFPPDFASTHTIYTFFYNGPPDRFQIPIFSFLNLIGSIQPKAPSPASP